MLQSQRSLTRVCTATHQGLEEIYEDQQVFHFFWSSLVGLHVSIKYMNIKLLVVMISSLDLFTGSCFAAHTVVTAFNIYRKKMWSSLDMKLEKGHFERTRKTPGNVSEPSQEKS